MSFKRVREEKVGVGGLQGADFRILFLLLPRLLKFRVQKSKGLIISTLGTLCSAINVKVQTIVILKISV